MSKNKSFMSMRTQAFLTAALSFVLLLTLFQLKQKTAQQRLDYQNAVYFVEANAKLAKGSDYLTSEARAFSVTKKIEHLNNFWNEVNVTKRRDAAVATLKELNGDEALLSLLVESKANSDALIQTELTSMRAVLEAIEVPVSNMPKPVADYTLPAKVSAMSKAEKINYAQQILFDKKYYADKRSIMAPLEKFQKLIASSMEANRLSQSGQTTASLYIAKALTVLLVILGVNMARLSSLNARKSPQARKKS
tara:strand:- start:5072 stop:5821 length:750 start_codon:yes stop_codon:yes gene_type:complete